MRVVHHDLCFGCGTANPRGLQLDLERRDDGSVAGSFLVEGDHQGPPGNAHGGVIAAVLDEAMSLAVHSRQIYALTARLSVDFTAPVPLGTVVSVRAQIAERGDGRVLVRSEAREQRGDGVLAEAEALFVERSRPPGLQ